MKKDDKEFSAEETKRRMESGTPRRTDQRSQANERDRAETQRQRSDGSEEPPPPCQIKVLSRTAIARITAAALTLTLTTTRRDFISETLSVAARRFLLGCGVGPHRTESYRRSWAASAHHWRS